MLGVIINNLNELRKQGYHFIENDKGDFLKVEKGNDILQTISLTSNGQLEVRSKYGDKPRLFNSVKYSMLHETSKNLCIYYFT